MFAPWRLPILVARPWRLCPELDPFTDEECETYIEAVRVSRWTALIGAVVIAVVVGPALLATGLIVADSLLPRHSPIGDTGSAIGRATAALAATAWMLATLSASLTPYCLILRRAIHRHLRHADCPHCRYSLLGLPVSAGRVSCPECGETIALANYGLRASDILIGHRDRGTRPAPIHPSSRMGWLGWTILGLMFAVVMLWVVTGQAEVLGLMLLPLSGLTFAATYRRANRID